MSKFYRLQGLQGYLLCIVRLPQVTKIVHKQRNKAMPKFYRLQHCKNELIKVTKFVTVTCKTRAHGPGIGWTSINSYC